MEGDHLEAAESTEEVAREVADVAGVAGELHQLLQLREAAAVNPDSLVLGQVQALDLGYVLEKCFVNFLDFQFCQLQYSQAREVLKVVSCKNKQ